jgi:type I restriction enzyme S subunit
MMDEVREWLRAAEAARKTCLNKPEFDLLIRQQKRRIEESKWNKEVLAFLDRQYPEAPYYKSSLAALWQKYLALGLPNAHFVSEFTSGKKEVVFQRAWEMMVALHLDAQGHRLTTSDEGPDFRLEHNGRTVWVEAVSPEPKGVPGDWLEHPKPGEFKVGDVPHTEVLLRWTAALNAKWEKLNTYREKGIVGENDAYVIAINGCQLGALALQHGVSGRPYAVEAVYALGPVAVAIDKQTGRVGKAFVTQRLNIANAKGAPVPTSLFLDPKYSGVSAIIACSMDRWTEASLPVDVVHNHFARVRLPERILGSTGEEWVTAPVGTAGEEIELRRLEARNPAHVSN